MHTELMEDGHDGPRYLSQSECGDAASCGVKWYARWVTGLRDGDESPRQQVGSMGHAILADRVASRFRDTERDPYAACDVEAERRGWKVGWSDGYLQAQEAANLAAQEVGLDHVHLLPDLYSEPGERGPGPLAEVRLRVLWNKVMWAMDQGGWSDILACKSVIQRFVGMEGQPDLVCLPEGPGGPVAIDDYKFRQKPDLGATDDAGHVLPDRQGTWYLTLLRALGLHAPSGFVFRQINAYAGRWLSVDDFMSPRAGDLVTEHGLPTCDISRMVDAGGMAKPEVWSEAHRLLAQRRLDRRRAEWGVSRRRSKQPERFTAKEEAKAREFVARLTAWRPVDVRTFRADPLVCREVVRDMIVGLEGPLSMAMRGVAPARHLQTYAGAPCTRAWGCPVKGPCQSSLGTFGVAATLRRAAEDAREAREAAREMEAAYA